MLINSSEKMRLLSTIGFIFVSEALIDIMNCSTLAVVSLAATFLTRNRSVVFLSNVLLLFVARSVVADKNVIETSSGTYLYFILAVQ